MKVTITYGLFCRAARCLLPVMLAAMCSCSAGDDAEAAADEPDNSAPKTMVLKIMPGVEGDLNATRSGGNWDYGCGQGATRAYNTDDNATEGEFINTLCVYMVDAGGYVEMVIKPDFTSGDIDAEISNAAAEGNLDEYTSEGFLVFPGRRSFYAFANWGNTEMAEVVNYNVGDQIDRSLIEKLVITDPASKINLTAGNPADRQYIPMSGMLPETDIYNYVGADNTIRIPVERLVSRLRLRLEGNSLLRSDIPVTSITVGGFADKVPLFADGADVSAFGYEGAVTFTPDDDMLVGGVAGFSAKDGYGGFADVYVNETKQGKPFTVKMTTYQYGGEMIYDGLTALSALPRNSIYPLTLKMLNMEPTIKAEMVAPPIGVVMKPQTLTFDGDAYRVTMYEGASFMFTPEMPAATATDISYEWDVPVTDKIKVHDISTGGVLAATLTARDGFELTLGLNVKWTSGKQQFLRAYKVYINVVKLDDYWPVPANSPAMRRLPSETMYLWKE